MSIFDDKDLCEELNYSANDEYQQYLKTTPSGIKFLPEKCPEVSELLLKSETGTFVKWIKKNHKSINLEIPPKSQKLSLNSNEYWMPLVFLASDMSLQVYLGIVASYIYDRTKGMLSNDKRGVHLKAVYNDQKLQVSKEFVYDGSIEGLENIIKKIDVNKLMEH